MFFVLEIAPNKYELVTHPLDGSILPGITWDSILKLAPDLFTDIKISEWPFKIQEFISAHNNGILKEVFVSGTASVIGEVHSIDIWGQNYEFIYKPETELVCTKIKQYLIDIQIGKIPHVFSHLIK